MKTINDLFSYYKEHNTKIQFLLILLSVPLLSHAQTLEQKAQSKIDSLNNLIVSAKTMGINVQKESMTVRSAQIFLKYANWDASNVSTNSSYFTQYPLYVSNATQMAQNLPDFERNEVILMLTKAISDFKSVISGAIVRKPTPIIDWSTLTIDKDQIMFNGKPVFLSDYIWKPGVSEFTDFFGQLDGEYITPNYVQNATGTISGSAISELQNKTTGKFGSVFMDHTSVPQWAINKYPNFQVGSRGYTKYDIDNYGSREVQGFLLKGTIPLMAGKKYTQMGYMLCNEPGWHTAAGSFDTGVVSDSTKYKFRNWLKTKYAAITELNSLWGKNFSSFDAVTVTIPMDKTLRGTPQWYDWMTFNMVRVTNWFTFLKDQILKYDNTAKVHIKVMPTDWTGSDCDHGLDFEALANLSDIVGNDAGAGAYSKNRNGGTETWMNRYAFTWREMCMSYDFFKSVAPDKPILNSETHFLSGYNFRDLYMTPEYTRAITWLANMQGLNASQTWVWGRNQNGSIKSETGEGYAGSIMQQPRVLNEVESTTMDLNANSVDMAAIQRLKRPLRIFYSKTSSISISSYMDNIYSLYESLFFNGIPLGFATQGIITGQNNSDWAAILVYQTPNVTRDELNALQSYLNNGGTVFIDGVSLKKDEYGRSLSPLTQGTGQLISTSSLSYMAYKALQFVTTKDLLPEVIVTETNTVGSGLNGCVWRCVKNDQGNNVLSVVNASKGVATLNIILKNAKNGTLCKDLLRGVVVSSTPSLQPNEVYFVEVIDSNGLSGINNPKKNDDKFAKLYPTHVDETMNIFFLESQKDVEMMVYNMNGCAVINQKYAGVKKISSKIDNLSKGVYIVKLISNKQSQTLYFTK